jgi:uncharacterized protein YndB with AHSA1/START domain
MARIVFDVEIAAEPGRVLGALDTAAGIKSWWTDDVVFPGGAGSEMSLGFPIAPKRFVLMVDEATEGRVAWRSVGEFPPHWVGTSIVWSISPKGSGRTVSVNFVHDGWANDRGPFGSSALTWGRLMDRLKSYCEKASVNPLFVRARSEASKPA